MKNPPSYKKPDKTLIRYFIHRCFIRSLMCIITISLSTKSSTAREFILDSTIQNESLDNTAKRLITTVIKNNNPNAPSTIPLEISCPGLIQSSGEEQRVVTDDFEDWKNGFTYEALCKGEIDYYISYNDGTEFKGNPKNLPTPDFCSGDKIEVRMVMTSDCENSECASTFLVVVSPQKFNIALPAVDYVCFGDSTPPTKSRLQVFSKQALLSFGVLSPCINVDEVEVSTQITGPFILGNEYNFYTTYTISASNAATEIAILPNNITWDPNPPILFGVPSDMTIECEDLIPAMPVVTAFDLVSGPLDVSTTTKTINTYCGKILQRTWSAKDDCRNTTTAAQIINIVDETAPILIVPDDLTLECGEPVPPPMYEASDNCLVYRVIFSEEKIVHNECEYTLTRKWVASDQCNNSTTAIQIIEVLDSEAPEITLVNPMLAGIALGAEIPMYGCESNPTVSMDDVRISDCCNFELSIADQLVSLGVCDVLGYYRKWRCSYTAIDPAGNTAEFYFYMVQYDTTPPTIYNVPKDLALACNEILESADTTVYAEDDCALNTHLELEEKIIYDPVNPSRYAVVRTWTAEDHCQNLTEEIQVITVCGFDTSLLASSIGNSVWFDKNRNGLHDEEEEGLNEIKINLFTYDTLTAEKLQLVASTQTRKAEQGNGQFKFNYLLPDFYVLEIEVPHHLQLTKMDAGENDLLDSDYNTTTAMTPFINLMTGGALVNYDAGLIQRKIHVTPAIPVIDSKIKLNDPVRNFDVRIFPNPVREFINLEFTSEESREASVQIYGCHGRLIVNQNLHAIKGLNQYQITMQNIPNGTYFIKVKMAKWIAYKMIIKAN